MEELKKKSTTIENDKEIVFSKAIKAGKRIYYLDVMKTGMRICSLLLQKAR